jgi:photosystem II stability/assembly factor-like uncharacterized protein
MALNVGDRALLFTNAKGRGAVTPLSSGASGDRAAQIPIGGGESAAIPLSTPVIGDRAIQITDISGKSVAVFSSVWDRGGWTQICTLPWETALTESQTTAYVLKTSETGKLLIGSEFGIVMASDDGGITWSTVSSPPTNGLPGLYLPSWCNLGDTIYVLGGYTSVLDNEVYISTDGGLNFSFVGDAEWAPRSLFSSVVLSDGAIVIYGGGAAGGGPPYDVWTSTDGGAHWTQCTADVGYHECPENVGKMIALPDDTLIIETDTKILKSTDRGQTWTHTGTVPTSDRETNWRNICSDTRGRLWFTSRNHNEVYFSRNYGANWTRITPTSGFSVLRYGSPIIRNGHLLLLGGWYFATAPDTIWSLQI